MTTEEKRAAAVQLITCADNTAVTLIYEILINILDSNRAERITKQRGEKK